MTRYDVARAIGVMLIVAGPALMIYWVVKRRPPRN